MGSGQQADPLRLGQYKGERKLTERSRVLDAITSKGMTAACEACGAKNWMVPHVADQPDKALELYMLIGRDLGPIVAFFPMICQNCSNTRLLHGETLLGGPL